MTNFIAKVAELRELAGRRQAIIDRQKETARPNHALLERLEIERDMVNAAPGLLAALGKVQAGDAKILAEILSFIESEATESDWEDAIGLLRRYADLARIMEDTP